MALVYTYIQLPHKKKGGLNWVQSDHPFAILLIMSAETPRILILGRIVYAQKELDQLKEIYQVDVSIGKNIFGNVKNEGRLRIYDMFPWCNSMRPQRTVRSFTRTSRASTATFRSYIGRVGPAR